MSECTLNEEIDEQLKTEGFRIIDACLEREVIITKIDDYQTGKRLRRYRESAGISLRALAGEMGVSAPYLSDLERGRRNWSHERGRSYIACLVNLGGGE